jgi:hypothetical protein
MHIRTPVIAKAGHIYLDASLPEHAPDRKGAAMTVFDHDGNLEYYGYSPVAALIAVRHVKTGEPYPEREVLPLIDDPRGPRTEEEEGID